MEAIGLVLKLGIAVLVGADPLSCRRFGIRIDDADQLLLPDLYRFFAQLLEYSDNLWRVGQSLKRFAPHDAVVYRHVLGLRGLGPPLHIGSVAPPFSIMWCS